jgi:predicted small secreted protein
MLKRYCLLLAVLIGFGSLSACNTIEGMGKDIKAGGGEIEDKAAKTKSGDK